MDVKSRYCVAQVICRLDDTTAPPNDLRVRDAGLRRTEFSFCGLHLVRPAAEKIVPVPRQLFLEPCSGQVQPFEFFLQIGGVDSDEPAFRGWGFRCQLGAIL